MWQQQKTLAPLYEELRNIQLFDRIHDYASDVDAANECAYAVRQARRRQILEEIAQLRVHRPGHRQPSRVTGAVALVCAVGYVMLYYVFR